MRKYLAFIGILLFGLASLSAQKTSTEKSVFKLFEKPKKILWMRHYKGTVNDANDVSIVLAYDGKLCRGRMKYLKSETEFGLIGFMKNQRIRLMEVDRQLKVSGYLEGTLKGKELTVDWSSVDNSVSNFLYLKELPKENRSAQSDCGKEKWIRTFRGLLNKEEVEFLLQLEMEDQIRGLAFFKKDGKTYEVKGKVNKGDEINVTLTDTHKKEKGVFRGHITPGGIVEAVFLSPYGARTKSNFWIHEEMEIGCLNYVDYVSSLNISYPKSKHPHFNDWMLSLAEKWKKNHENHVHKAQRLGQERSPETRLSIRTDGWCDVDFLSLNIISGTLWLSNSWEKDTKGTPFTFNLESGMPITQSSIFEKDFNLQDFIWNYISEDIQEHRFYKDYDFRKWLSTASFHTFSVRKEGINFSTPFNDTYGQQQVTIPFEKLKPHMNTNGPVWKLASMAN